MHKPAPLHSKRRGALVVLASLLLAFAASGCARKAPRAAAGAEQGPPLVLDRIAPRPGGDLIAGAATVDLTPYDKAKAGDVYIAGFGQARTSKGVRDPVMGHVLYLDNGREWVVFASLDFVGLLNDEVAGIRSLVTREHPNRLIVSSTHNHQGPDTMGYWGFGLLIPFSSGKDSEYMTWMRGQVAEAITRAVASARPARVRFGAATVPEGISANLWFPDDPTRKDNQLTAMAVEDLAGKRIATMVNYANHPEALFEQNRELSSDYPGRVYREMEKRNPGSVTLFVSGALGGMVIPYPNRFDKRDEFDDLEKRIAFIDHTGELLARITEEALAAGSAPLGPADVPLALQSREIWLPLDNGLFDFVMALGIVDLANRPRKDDGQFRAEVHRIDIGPARMVAVPGEIFPSLGALYKKWLETPYPFIVGLANDELGYIMGAVEFEDSTYGYEQSMSIGPKTGPILTRAVEDLFHPSEPAPPGILELP